MSDYIWTKNDKSWKEACLFFYRLGIVEYDECYEVFTKRLFVGYRV